MKKITTIVVLVSVAVGLGFLIHKDKPNEEIAVGAPVSNQMRNLLPIVTQTYDLGTTTPDLEWKGIYTQDLFVSGTCTGCGGGGDSFAWTTETWGVSTSTTLGFTQGFLSNASSTLTSDLRLSSLSAGGLGVGTGGLVYSGATTTAGTGLTYSSNAFNVNTSQNIATLSNLTDNGFVKTSGGVGTLSIDTSTYLTNVDISANTNLASTWPVILTGDTLSFSGLSTSTSAVVGNIPYFSGTNTFANIATTTLTVSSPLSLSNPVFKVGGSNSTLTLDTSGAWDGTAGSLASNGGNCSAGSYPLGVDTLGAVESCTDATTEIDSAISTHAGVSNAHQALVTLSGTPDYITLSGQDIIRGTIDIGDDTNLTAGRSLTLTGDDILADTELYTYGISANLIATTTADGIATTTENFISVRVPIASTITGFNCYADDTGTSTVRATVASDPLSAGTDILYTTGVRCGAQVYTATTTFSTTAVSAGDIIRFYVSDAEPTGSRPRIIYPSFELTKND